MNLLDIPEAIPCSCYKPPFMADDYIIKDIGVDAAQSRNGEVSFQQCKKCGSHWVKYLYEQEAFSNSGRWFRGILSIEKSNTLTPENTVDYLETLDWYFYGGSFFQGQIRVGKGRLHL